jgi:hypothetical protein
MMKTHLCSRFAFEGPPMTVMKFGRASVQDAQAIDRIAAMIRERGDENLATISASTNMLAPGNDPAPKARSRLAHPEASNAKPEGWVKHKMRLSPVGATQEGFAPRLTANEILSFKFCPTTRQVSGHEFTRAAQPQNILGFSPCKKDSQGLKANSSMPFTARLELCPDTCPDRGNDLVLFSPALLRASAPPQWVPLFRSPDHPITRSPDLEWVLP